MLIVTICIKKDQSLFFFLFLRYNKIYYYNKPYTLIIEYINKKYT